MSVPGTRLLGAACVAVLVCTLSTAVLAQRNLPVSPGSGELAQALSMRCGVPWKWAQRGLPAIGIRAGINTGPLMSGSLGVASRQSEDVRMQGSCVNACGDCRNESKAAP